MPEPGKSAPRGAATRARLLVAARQVVADVGYPHATTKAIAAAAGVAEGTIYRHFPDKHALFLAAVVDANRPVVEWMSRLPARAGQATVAGNLAEALQRLAQLREHMLPLELAMLTDPELAQRRRAGLAAGVAAGQPPAGLPTPDPVALLAQYLAAEQRLGRVRSDQDPAAAAITILALLFGLAMVLDVGGPIPAIPGQSATRGSDLQLLLVSAIDLLTRGLST